MLDDEGLLGLVNDLTRIKIGDWTVVPTLNVIERDGESIKLEPRAMDLLVYLARARERVVSPDELLRDVWQGRVYDDGIVYKKINQLRKAFGDDSQSPRFIATIPKRGYRLVAAVALLEDDSSARDASATLPATTAPALPLRTPVPPPPPTTTARSRWAAAAVATVLAVGTALSYAYFLRSPPHRAAARPVSVAVLPCQNLSADPEKAFALGIHEELIEQLAKADFKVIARTAVMPYLDHPKPMPDIARELNVGVIMECSVQYADGRVRIGVALADAATSDTLWRESYDRAFSDVFAIESDIAFNVARALEAKLSPQQIATLEEIPSRSARAIEFYFSARRYEQLGVLNWATAAEQYARAVAEDPQFARAFAQLALLRVSMSLSVQPRPVAMEQARAAAEKALAIDSDLIQGRLAMLAYRVYADQQSVADALEELNALEPLAEGLSEFYLIRRNVHFGLGDQHSSLADASRAVALGPVHDVPLLVQQAVAFAALRRYQEAEAILERVTDIAPDDWGTRIHKATLPMFRDGDTRALRALEPDVMAGRIPPADPIWVAAWMDRDYEAVLRIVDSVQAPLDNPGIQLIIGTMRHNAGQEELARPALEKARDLFWALLGQPGPLGLRLRQKAVLSIALSYLGATDESIRNTREVVAELDSLPAGEAVRMRRLTAEGYGSAGAVELAVAELEKYFSHDDEWSIEGLARIPHFDPIRDDPRFKALVAKYSRR